MADGKLDKKINKLMNNSLIIQWEKNVIRRKIIKKLAGIRLWTR